MPVILDASGDPSVKGGTWFSRSVPEADGSVAQPEVARQELARAGPLDASSHAFAQRVGLDHLDEQRGGVADVEEVSLPRPLPVPRVPEPAAADPRHLVRASVGARAIGDLLPEPDHLALEIGRAS